MTQNNLGVALRELARLTEGPRSAELLSEAVAACRLALEVCARDRLPQAWAATQNNLGAALGELAGRTEGPRVAELRSEAVAAYRLALEVYTRDQLPQEWATTQNNLGAALCGLASSTGGPRSAELLTEAVAAFRLALEVRTRDQLPQDWAMTQNNLGIALQIYFAMNEFRAGLEQFRQLMKEKRLSDAPESVALVHVLEVLHHRALGEGDRAAEALDALIVHIKRQPDSFRIPGAFSELRTVVERSKVKAVIDSRNFLLAFLDAASKENRQEILQGLRRLPIK
jgi:tetratricopeptide (TPR) repeat protein